MEILHECTRPLKGFTVGNPYLIDLDYICIDDTNCRVNVSNLLRAFKPVTEGIEGSETKRYLALNTTHYLTKGIIYHLNNRMELLHPNGKIDDFEGIPDDVLIPFPEYKVTEEETQNEEPSYENQLKQPPIGIMPEYIWEEKKNFARLTELLDAIQRYREDGTDVPKEWEEEALRRCFKHFEKELKNKPQQ